MPRGRLIFPFLVDLARIDTEATAADPDASGLLTSGYDGDFREPVAVPLPDSSAIAAPRRVETIVQLKAQIETEEQERLQMMLTGRSPNGRLALVFHYKDLEAAGMVTGSTGRPLLRGPGDRLAAIRNVKTGVLIEEIPSTPGLFAVEVRSIGFGLGTYRNLLLMIFEERELGVVGARG
jgi:hypothetical protein